MTKILNYNFQTDATIESKIAVHRKCRAREPYLIAEQHIKIY